MKRILGLAATGVGVWVATLIVPQFEFEGTFLQFVLVAVLLGVANVIVRPVLRLLSLPIILITLGLFLLVINAGVLQLIVWLSSPERLDLGLTSGGFGWTFLAALVVSIVHAVIDRVFIED